MILFKSGDHFCRLLSLIFAISDPLLYPKAFEKECEGIELGNKPSTIYWAA
jgi:hypothetical protein